MDAALLVEFAGRERASLVSLKTAHWRERKARLGDSAGIHAADALREHFQHLHPDWPQPDTRAEDVREHQRIGEMLRRVSDR